MSRQAAFILCFVTAGIVGWGAFSAGYSLGDQGEKPRLYELRTYTTNPGKLPALHARFRDHTMRLFEKHGMQNVMYWVPTDAERKDNTLIYVVSHASPEAAKASWAAFIGDPEWREVAKESEKDGKIVSKLDSIYMTPTDYSPKGK